MTGKLTPARPMLGQGGDADDSGPTWGLVAPTATPPAKAQATVTAPTLVLMIRTTAVDAIAVKRSEGEERFLLLLEHDTGCTTADIAPPVGPQVWITRERPGSVTATLSALRSAPYAGTT